MSFRDAIRFDSVSIMNIPIFEFREECGLHKQSAPFVFI